MLRCRGIILLGSSTNCCKIRNYGFSILLLLYVHFPSIKALAALFLFPNVVNFLFTYASRLKVEALKITPAKKNRRAVTIKPAYEVTYEGIVKECKGLGYQNRGNRATNF
uniref:Uncharacterized protein n=1 Tax=Glossina palpalis gambiensis TaxID=67801 RepID=A0A1B0BPZ7_9MUSC